MLDVTGPVRVPVAGAEADGEELLEADAVSEAGGPFGSGEPSVAGAELDVVGADVVGADVVGADVAGADVAGADVAGADVVVGADVIGASEAGGPFGSVAPTVALGVLAP